MCYAERVASRFSGPGMPYEGLAKITPSGPRWTGEVRLIEEHLEDPLRWKKPRRIFVNSMSDLFHEGLSDEQIDRVFAVMARAPQHQYQVLTKRAERLPRYFARWALPLSDYPHMWIGVSCEDQKTADERIPFLLQTRAAVRFISAEPLLGPLDLAGLLAGIDWVIVGAESGPGRRPMKHAWAESIVAQCRSARVAVFIKQLPRNGKVVHDMSLFPEGLRIQEFPEELPAR